MLYIHEIFGLPPVLLHGSVPWSLSPNSFCYSSWCGRSISSFLLSLLPYLLILLSLTEAKAPVWVHDYSYMSTLCMCVCSVCVTSCTACTRCTPITAECLASGVELRRTWRTDCRVLDITWTCESVITSLNLLVRQWIWWLCNYSNRWPTCMHVCMYKVHEMKFELPCCSSLVFMLFLGVRFSESIQLVSLFPLFSDFPPDLLVSFSKRQ